VTAVETVPEAADTAGDLPTGSVAVVLGTRPEAIKLAELVRLLGPAAWVLHTGQHYDASLAAEVLSGVGFRRPHLTLGVGGSSRGAQIGNATVELDRIFARTPPAVVVVQGDTNATLAGAMAANVNDVPLVHVEAGLRSFDRAMPEEHNRVLVDHLSDVCCAPTPVAAGHLLAEGIPIERIQVTGNTVVEAVQRLVPDPGTRAAQLAEAGLTEEGFVLATLHRPENTDKPGALAAALAGLAALPLPVVLPLHPRTRERVQRFGLDDQLARLRVIDPLPPQPFLGLAAEAALWVTDSGGLQEEASVLKKPVIVMRRSTERPEVQGTFADLVDPSDIAERARAWLEDRDRRRALAHVPSPYGDGNASHRIASLVAACAAPPDAGAPADHQRRRVFAGRPPGRIHHPGVVHT
jgi:UDP-N-acetylglucosamine 2-epimerase (non-hydrolysing)